MQGEFDIREHYFKLLSQDPSKSMPIAAIESLSALCDATKAGTIHELMSAIGDGADALKNSIPNAISLTAGCDLFKRFIIAHAHDDPKDFEAFKQQLQANGHLFAQRAREARIKVAETGVKAIKDGVTVFLHGHSRCVIALLQRAAEQNIRFNAIATETRPSLLGLRTAKELRALGIPVAVVDDNAMGYALKKAQLVIIGAEGVFGDGSILNIVCPRPPQIPRRRTCPLTLRTVGILPARPRCEDLQPSGVCRHGDPQVCRYIPTGSVQHARGTEHHRLQPAEGR